MSYQDTYEAWLNSPALSAQEKAELESIRSDEKEKESRFFDQLSFGTAGLRGIMGVGLYRMNVHVIRHATQAFAQVILEEGEKAAARGVAICFDCRNNSQTFAREAAQVMAANGIPVRLFQALRPTPELSFAVREYGCIAGINITASHNPKEYNGYKVYWEDGAQLPPKHADQVAKKMKELDVFTGVKTMPYDQAVAQGKIVLMGEETDEAFLSHVMAQVNDRAAVEKVADTFKMVYTPFHGTGYKLIPEVLHRLGMKHVICVPEQMVIDGNFPTVVSPNPENPEGFYLAVDIAKREGADFILGSVHNLSPERGGTDLFFLDFSTVQACYDALDDYFASLALLAATDFYAVLAHLIYPLRYMQAPVTLNRYQDAIRAILRTAVEKGRGMEVNTCRGRTLEEWRPILALYRDCGGELVTVGSDAHTPADVGKGVRAACALLRECGFRRVCTYEKHQPVFHTLG